MRVIVVFLVLFLLWAGHLTASGPCLDGVFMVKYQRGAMDCHQGSVKYWQDVWKREVPGFSMAVKFPGKEPITDEQLEANPRLADLSLIYEVQFAPNYDREKVRLLLLRSGLFAYVEDVCLPGLFTPGVPPDDPNIDQQYYLEHINAFRAWQVHKGDTNTVIGISDTGTELDHPDLIHAIAYNYNDPINGTDSDNDGYVDNFHGWDLGEGNNDPSVNYHAHGVGVSGVLAATTNNQTGMAGVGYNTRFLPVKIDDASGALIMGYESMVYAANNGCVAVNCSWGGQKGAGQYGQDIVDYVTYNKDMLVIAAAGNSNNEVENYPAAYENVLSVGATDRKDHKAFFSTYNYSVDLSAPGRGIHSTWVNGNYVNLNGTSFAAPMVAATAGLLRSYKPHLNALQTAQQIRVTTRELYNDPVTVNYKNKMGTGVLDMYKALTENSKSAVRFSREKWKRQGLAATAYDTLLVYGDFTSYLKATPLNSTAVLRCNHPAVLILDSIVHIGGLNSMQNKNNYNTPFRIVLLPNMPLSETIHFKIHYNYGEQTDYQYISHTFNKAYHTLDAGNFKITFNSSGKVAYNDGHFKEGQGLILDGINRSMLNTGGLIAGLSSSRVSNAVYGQSGHDNHFVVTDPMTRLPADANSPHAKRIRSRFNDDGAGLLKTGLAFTQTILDGSEPEDDNAVVVEYVVKNPTSSTISNLYLGYYLDWSVRYSHRNRAEWNPVKNLAYVYDTDGYATGGLRLIHGEQPVFHYAFDNDGTDNSININNGFPSWEKWLALRTNRERAGFDISAGNNVSHMVSSGPYTIQPGDSVVVAWAIMAGNNLPEVENAAKKAWENYHQQPLLHAKKNNKMGAKIYPNPASKQMVLKMEKQDNWKWEIYSIQRKVIGKGEFSGDKTTINIQNVPKGICFLRVFNEKKASWIKVLVI